MFKQLGKDNYSDGDSAFDENRTLHLRSILKESIDLPAEVLSVEFSHIHDRILDQKVFSELLKPPTSGTEAGDWSKRCHNRVDLHARLTHLLQPGNDPHQAMRIAVFSKI